MLRALIAFVCFGLAGPALATQDRWPALFDVTGVGSDDSLNVRTEPSASAEIIGTLPHDATGVEVVRPNETETWGLVNLGERSGWVSLSFMQRLPGQWLGAPIESARCFGTEPFWSLTFDESAASKGGQNFVTWSTPEDSVSGEGVHALGDSNRRDVSGLTYSLQDGRDGAAILTLGACNDGMSDRDYGIGISVIDALNGDTPPQLYSGCCSLQMDLSY